jgi:hypothetical protein
MISNEWQFSACWNWISGLGAYLIVGLQRAGVKPATEGRSTELTKLSVTISDAERAYAVRT